MNHIIVDIYWIVLFILQFGYITHLFSANADYVNAAASVGSHFILNNLLHFAFVMLFVRSHFGWAELILIINFFNLSSLYFRHNTYPRFIHAPVASGPLAWTFVAIYWNGAIMVPHPHSLVARIFGNIFIWSILAYGSFFIVIYKVSFSPNTVFLSNTHHSAGLHHGLLAQLPRRGHWCWPIPPSNCCPAVDLRLRHHGSTLPRNLGRRRARLDWKGDQVEARPRVRR
jgi:hypothetical protein